MKTKTLIVAIALSVSLIGCATVPPGNVGVKVYQAGGKRGQMETLEVGRYGVNPITEEIYNFPTYRQNLVWQHNEDPDKNEQITLNSSEGASFTADVAISYSFDPAKAEQIFSEFRQSPEVIADVYVRRMVQDSFNRVGSTMKAIEIYGEQKSLFLDNVLKEIQADLDPLGFKVYSISFVTLRPDAELQSAINSVITAKQEAERARQEVEKAKANGEAAVATARAQAEANRLQQESITAELLQKQAIEKWNGVLPQVTSGATPFIQLQQPVPPAQ